MKILMICPYFFPNIAGAENYAYNLSKGLIKKGHKITVLCSTKEGKNKTETIDGIKIIRQKPDFILSNTPIKLNLYFTISKLLKEEKFDLVNANTPVPYYADMACYATKRQKVPFILTYHNDNVHPNKIVNFLCNLYNPTFNSLTLKHSTKIITPSPFCFNKSRFLKKHKNKLSWIPPGIDLTKFKPKKSKYILEKYNLKKNSKTILFVGHMGTFHKHKGVDVLINAIKKVNKTNKNTHLILVGKGDAKEYKKLCEKQNIKNTIFAGFVKDETLPKYYQSADILVLPTTTEQEGFGMVLLEAMACGGPVIGTKIGGIPYVIKNNKTGLLIEPKNPLLLANAIKKLLNNKELWKKLSKNGLKESKKYDWKKVIDKTEKLFKGVVQ
ncbi:MAG: glycosyltransferase family 4 protein [Candidatus Aenigmarchaeota archaeon]|nr:glycosyltransferase family 4 protein [Candidatus Aenigmarchaeota archaeon]